ncbi:MAG: NAD(P)H-hydrate dehydratase [Caulobacterales bacterium]|nr:NAD(P)H-hydrate dehydratase [Caulobacterales bacterium]
MTIDPHALLTVDDHARADAAAERLGTPRAALMEAAGAAVASAICERFSPDVGAAIVLCGPGDNGGDGYVAARHLSEMGWKVRVAALGAPAPDSAAAEAAGRWTGPTSPLAPGGGRGGVGVVVDALFGAGLSRPLDGAAADAARAWEAAPPDRRAPVVAVDLPSGVEGDTGAARGPAMQAALTVTFLAPKPGHALEPGRARCGELVLADIGHPPGVWDDLARRAWRNDPARWADRFPWPDIHAHKHARGRLFVVSGGLASTGAARLAARAGLRVGAGLVTLMCPPDAVAVVAAASTAVMTQHFESPSDLARRAAGADAVVIGPGAGLYEATRDHVAALLAHDAPAVLDADALTVFAGEPKQLFAALRGRDVLTPHAGEFARLFPDIDLGAVDRLTAARRAAARGGAVVVLKGPDTVIAAPTGEAMVNTNATPFLATAGSGDVLAGFIAGLIAQGMESFAAACAAVWLHGEAARSVGPGLIAEDLAEALPITLRRLYDQR